MWDAGFELGQAVESLVESEKALTQDMDTKTALIESRWVCGARKVARGDPQNFVDGLFAA